jgi:hypothetical protein
VGRTHSRSADRRRNGASIAKFRTRRPAHICETSRYRAVFERPSYVTRWRRTGWLGRQDSNFRIKEACPIGPSAIVRRKEWQQMVCQSPSRWGARSASSTEASGTQIPRCRGSSPAAPASQSNLHRLTREHRSKRRGTPLLGFFGHCLNSVLQSGTSTLKSSGRSVLAAIGARRHPLGSKTPNGLSTRD